MKLHIKKGDVVFVNSGDYKGHKGKVLAIFPQKQRAIVEGANMVSKHTKPNAKNSQGGVIKREAPIHISNLMLVDSKSSKPTRIRRHFDKSGKSVRISVKSGEVIK